eukprot:TRINITY_DN5218_c0_g1_i1.p1 TRINITY_DN5218_c0_g1~~TRINITY_DN5218_c0_g1_i1.p1  ORF type:complete len:337 (-),score=52.28 TRINITY_DN5218_c0_g1_i1:624-1634(-)
MLIPAIGLLDNTIVDLKRQKMTEEDPLSHLLRWRVPILVVFMRWKPAALVPSEVRSHFHKFLVRSPADRFRAGPELPTMPTPRLPGEPAVQPDHPRTWETEAREVELVKQIAASTPTMAGGLLSLETCLDLLASGVEKLVVDASNIALMKCLPRDRVIAWFAVPNDEADVEELVMSVAPYSSGLSVHRAHAATIQVPPSDFFVAQLKHVCRLAFGDRTPMIILGGGISTVEQVVKLHRAGVHAGAQTIVESAPHFVARAMFECARAPGSESLIPTMLLSENRQPLSLVFSSLETLAQGMESGKATYLASERHGQVGYSSLFSSSEQSCSTCLSWFL